MATIGTLAVNVVANTDELRKGLKGAERVINAWRPSGGGGGGGGRGGGGGGGGGRGGGGGGMFQNMLAFQGIRSILGKLGMGAGLGPIGIAAGAVGAVGAAGAAGAYVAKRKRTGDDLLRQMEKAVDTINGLDQAMGTAETSANMLNVALSQLAQPVTEQVAGFKAGAQAEAAMMTDRFRQALFGKKQFKMGGVLTNQAFGVTDANTAAGMRNLYQIQRQTFMRQAKIDRRNAYEDDININTYSLWQQSTVGGVPLGRTLEALQGEEPQGMGYRAGAGAVDAAAAGTSFADEVMRRMSGVPAPRLMGGSGP